MATKKRMKYCDWCGAELGMVPAAWVNEPESCGDRECDRQVRDMINAEDEERRMRAEEDNYARY